MVKDLTIHTNHISLNIDWKGQFILSDFLGSVSVSRISVTFFKNQ